ncbi:MAG: NAD-binding protein [Thermodesulfobacteriota bacterium]
MEHFRPLLKALCGIILVLVGGTLGYKVVEGWGYLDGFYMTVITISTIGFKEVHDLSPNGQVLTIAIILSGMGMMGYALVTGTRLIVEGEVQQLLTRRRSMKAIGKISDHFVICGFGRMGSLVCHELHARKIPFLVIEPRTEIQDKVIEAGFLLIPGDATEEEVLISAGIKKARGLVSLLPNDALNVYVVLTARQLNPALEIIARAEEESAHGKLQMAGANRVISPYKLGGMRLVMGILKPTVMNFLEVAMDHKDLNVDIEEVRLGEESPYCGKALVETDIRRDLNLIIIAVEKKNGPMVFNPGPNTVIECHDTLIAMGEREKLDVFRKKAHMVVP